MKIKKLVRLILVAMMGWTGIVGSLEAARDRNLIARAAHVRPTRDQIAWQEMELIAFIHFTVNTFTDMEWGDGTEDPAIFNPTDLDTRQWVRVCKDAGMKMIILTAKHHDGFCLWPSQYTDHTVENSPYKNGKGDIVGELAQACRNAGLKLGLYLSPWDRHEPTYGDTQKYNDFYIKQLQELLSHYGPVAEVWLDGAKGKDAKDMMYDWDRIYATVRRLQPHAVIFNGPDIRWVGNEHGYARETEWSVLPRSDDWKFSLPDNRAKDLGSLEKLRGADNLVWYPAESDVSIRPGWFYHADEDDDVKSLEKLLDIYYGSVGRNSLLLLNLPPDRRGLIHENDIRRLQEFRKVLDATFDENLAAGAAAKASQVRADNPVYAAAFTTDDSPDTYWSTDDWTTAAEIEYDLGADRTFNVVMLQEYIPVGQRVSAFVVEVEKDGAWQEITRGTTIGYKRLLRVPDTSARYVRVRITESRLCPTLSNFALYYQPPLAELGL